MENHPSPYFFYYIMMKATFAFLTDNHTQNLVRKLTWDIHQKYRTGIDFCRLQPHISLTQPFDIYDLEALSNYMDQLAGSIEPFEMRLPQLELIDATIDGLESGIIWLSVEETESLRGIHNRLNEELTQRFGNVQADFDGDRYHFHMSVAIGGQPIGTYNKIFHEFKDRLGNLQFMVRELVMFVYDERSDLNAGYMTYKILPLDINRGMSF